MSPVVLSVRVVRCSVDPPDKAVTSVLTRMCAQPRDQIRRHGGCTRNLRAVQVLLGHASIATTERYVAVDDSEIRAAMEAASGD